MVIYINRQVHTDVLLVAMALPSLVLLVTVGHKVVQRVRVLVWEDRRAGQRGVASGEEEGGGNQEEMPYRLIHPPSESDPLLAP